MVIVSWSKCLLYKHNSVEKKENIKSLFVCFLAETLAIQGRKVYITLSPGLKLKWKL